MPSLAQMRDADYADRCRERDEARAEIASLTAALSAARAEAEAWKGHVEALLNWSGSRIVGGLDYGDCRLCGGPRGGVVHMPECPVSGAHAALARLALSAPACEATPHDPLACPCCMAAAETCDPETFGHFENARGRRLGTGRKPGEARNG